VVIDDDRLFCDAVRHVLEDLEVQVITAHTGTEGLRLCAGAPVDVVLLDQKFPDANGIDFCGPILDCHGQLCGDQDIRLSPERIAAMQDYAWPGNVRELRNVLERAILVGSGPQIEPSRLLGGGVAPDSANNDRPDVTAIEPLHVVEHACIRQALHYYNHNHTHTARAPGISRSALMRKIKQYGLCASPELESAASK
jgi:DNA-binding NtrC family response regulator